MLKYIGTAAVCLVLAVGGLYLSAKIGKTKRCRAELRRLVECIENGISFGSLPLSRILEHFETPVLQRCGFCDMLRKEGFEAAMPCVLPLLDADSAEVMAEFAASVGKSAGAASETALCKRTLAALESVEQTRKSKEDIRAALFARLGLLAAIAAALALL